MPSYVHSSRSLLGLALALVFAASLPAQTAPSTATLNGQSLVNHVLVGVGRMPAGLKDRFGETFGSFSAFTFEPGTWQRQPDGSYTGTLLAQPDRGYNAVGTTNYVPRFNKISVRFTPAPAGGRQNQVALELVDTIRFAEADGTLFTSLDPNGGPSGVATRPGFPPLPAGFNGRLALDAEGIVSSRDGTVWVSDEYGPYVFKFSAAGRLLSVIRPPEAIVPKRGGVDSFASNNPTEGQPAPAPLDPVTGRQNNQGLEGLTVSPDGRTLFTLLQSAARQDGGLGATVATRDHTRLLAYDLTGATPTLKGEYVLRLPSFRFGAANRVAAQSELLALNQTQFLVIARDSAGRGLAASESLYRRVLLYDISGATNIAGTAFDQPGTPLAPAGVLAPGVVPAARTEFIDLNDRAQLAKFGLHNGLPDDADNLSEKWEALALVPALDPTAPNDWFLFVGNDNDFITTDGFQVGAPYKAAFDNDTMVLVYRITIPARLANVSSRAQTGGGATHIAGFVVTGARPKTLLVRGIGPGLAGAGVTGALADPVLTVFDRTGRELHANDNWTDGEAAELRAAAVRAGAFPLADGSRDAALLLQLDPGVYTAQITAAAGGAGISLLEIYELP